eukprot:5370357-Amphidinium_carterae.2
MCCWLVLHIVFSSELSQEAGLKLKAAVEHHELKPSERSFPLASVERQTTTCATLYEDFIVMTATEFTKVMGCTPKAKDPKIPIVNICNGSLGMEKLYVFRDEKQVGRRLRIETSMGDSLAEQVMSSDCHLHAGQGGEFLKWSSAQRLEGGQLQELTQPTHSAVCISEYYQKLHKRAMPGSATSPTTTASDGLQRLSTSEPVDGPDGDEKGDEGDENEEEEEFEEKVILSSAAPCLQLPTTFQGIPVTPGQGSKKRKSQEAAQSAGEFRAKKQGIVRSVSQVGLCDGEDDREDTNSVVQPSLASWKTGGSAAKLTWPEQVAHWVEKLDILQVVNGKKLGVLRNHAEAAAAKMPLAQKLELTNHIDLSKKAAHLAPDVVSSKSTEEIHDAITAISSALPDFVWPLELQTFMFSKDCKELLLQASTSMDKAHLSSMWARVRPNKHPEDMNVIDVKAPSLCFMSLAENDKCEKFQQIVIQELLLNLVLGGQSKYQVLAFAVGSLLDLIADELLMDTASDEEVTKSCVTANKLRTCAHVQEQPNLMATPLKWMYIVLGTSSFISMLVNNTHVPLVR